MKNIENYIDETPADILSEEESSNEKSRDFSGSDCNPKHREAELEKMQKVQDLKGVLRKAEGIFEVAVLSLVYYLICGIAYKAGDNAFSYGEWAVVLVLIYAILLLVIFYLCDSFKYGHRKLSEVVVSQVISLIIVDFVTYLQLCLMNMKLLNPLPMMLLLVLDVVLALLCCIAFARIYHNIYVPKNMVMIYGNEKAVDLKFKMDERPDKYCVTKVVPYTVGFDRIRQEIAGHDAVVINDVPA